MQFVKASERLPDLENPDYHFRLNGKKVIGNFYDKNGEGEIIFFVDGADVFESYDILQKDFNTIEWLDEGLAKEGQGDRTVIDLTDDECLKGSEIIGGASHLSKESQVYQFREIFKDLFWRQTNVSGKRWFELYEYFKSINVQYPETK